MKEDEAFHQFCLREHPRLVGALSLYCGDADVAEEMAQEALARAYRDWRKVARMAAPRAWIYRVGVNLVHSHYRRRRSERAAVERLQARPRVDGDATDVAATLVVRQAAAAIPTRQRTALVLRYYLDLPVDEVAGILGLSKTAVTSLTHRALGSLRSHLGDDIVDREEAQNAS